VSPSEATRSISGRAVVGRNALSWHISPPQKELYPGEAKGLAANVCQYRRKNSAK
jgi:hypothetical protein